MKPDEILEIKRSELYIIRAAIAEQMSALQENVTELYRLRETVALKLDAAENQLKNIQLTNAKITSILDQISDQFPLDTIA